PAAAGEGRVRAPEQETPGIQVEGSLPRPQADHGLASDALDAAAKAIAGAPSVLFAVCTGHWLRGRAAQLGAAVANLALASGKIAGEGNGIVFLPEKNNSMGSMEVGLLADRKAGFEPAAEAGLTMDQMLTEDGGIQALYVIGENIYDRVPDVPALIVQDILMSETASRADVLFPANTYAERQGTFTNFEGRVQWFNRAIPPIGQSRPDWLITAELARRVAEKLGKDPGAFSYRSVVDVTKELEKAVDREIPPAPSVVPGHGNPVGNQLHAAIRLTQSVRAPETPLGPQGDSRFNVSPGGNGEQASETGVTYRYQPVEAVTPPATTADHPLILITAPHRWINGSTSRYADGLIGLYPNASVDINPADAAELGVEQSDAVRIESANGGVLMRAQVNRDMPRGVAMVPGYVQPPFVISEGQVVNRLFGSTAGAVAVRIERREAKELGFAGFNERVPVAAGSAS
ncbi:MAG TPA: molybdopterin-dependent oxidoreductase, partial [Chloroflexota bacterium]|nr:molybdopterin-dependent oxidoreductase [Chloroflexota bacterium]